MMNYIMMHLVQIQSSPLIRAFHRLGILTMYLRAAVF